jgi:hypothetical protein
MGGVHQDRRPPCSPAAAGRIPDTHSGAADALVTSACRLWEICLMPCSLAQPRTRACSILGEGVGGATIAVSGAWCVVCSRTPAPADDWPVHECCCCLFAQQR